MHDNDYSPTAEASRRAARKVLNGMSNQAGKFIKKVIKKIGIGAFLGFIALVLVGAITIIPIIVFIGGQGNDTTQIPEGQKLSEKVLLYYDEITKQCVAAGIPSFVYIVCAVMMQESRGEGLDPMQSSECGYNTKYPNKPNSITDPSYSIECGVKYLADCFKKAGCETPSDLPKLYLALQGYNFGMGYITWAQERGGYSETNALEFSNMKKQELGWSIYGDPLYIQHVMQFVNLSGDNEVGEGEIVGDLLISELGYATPCNYSRISRAYNDPNPHSGIDLAAPEGTPILAARDGVVVQSGETAYGQGFGGYGLCVAIDHGDSYYTLYAHASKLLVSKGQTVKRGQIIAEVGNTGNSFGNHLHFEVRQGISVQGARLDPDIFVIFKGERAWKR